MIQWVKLSTGFFEDEKVILLLSDHGSDIVVFFLRLLTLAGKQNQNGLISFSENIPYSAKNLGKICQISAKKCENFLKILEKFQIIFRNNGLIFLTNWEKHQSQDKLDKIRRQQADRVKRWRAKQQECNVTETLPLRYSNATDLDLEEDLEDLRDIGQVEKSNLPDSNLKSSPINQEIFDPLDGIEEEETKNISPSDSTTDNKEKTTLEEDKKCRAKSRADEEKEKLNEISRQVLQHLNAATGRHYRLTDALKRKVNARCREGFGLTDFKCVIDKKTREWKNTAMEMYLRPETLFGTKFDAYLNEPNKSTPPKGGISAWKEYSSELT
jgi:uncharacterized phage protein (TIGR02220 family)/predicted phage replisome organizer